MSNVDNFTQLVIVGRYLDLWLIEYGVGCSRLWYAYPGYGFIIDKPSKLFIWGIGARIYIPDRDQDCRIWDAEFLGYG